MPAFPAVLPELPPVPSRLCRTTLPQVAADVAPVVTEASPVTAELVPGPPGGGGLSGRERRGAHDQGEKEQERSAASHTSFQLRSRIRRAVARDVRRAVWNTRDA